MNLIDDPFIPVRRRDGERIFIAPWQVTDDHATNPIVAIDAPRPDFSGSLHELLIALLQASTAPIDEDDEKWEDWLNQPPMPETLKQALAPLSAWFKLDGDGSRFMQDLELSTEAGNNISDLLIDAPGGNTLKNNADHFVKRGGAGPMSPEAAAVALWTLQCYAPSGGVGHRTSLRGGGPLTTLVILDPAGSGLEPSLWRTLWLNVIDQEHFEHATGNSKRNTPADRYPWLAPTRTSEGKGGAATHAEQVHPLQMYFGMPRRIRLDLEHRTSGQCSIYGTDSDQLITAYASKNYGINYDGNWEHPLSPHRRDAKTGATIPLHPHPGGISYQDWPAMALGNSDQSVTPALVVRQFDGRKLPNEQLRIWAFGYDMDNAKARGWCDATLPLYSIAEAQREEFTARVEQLVLGANEVAGYLKTTLKQAWFDRPKDAGGDVSFIAQGFYQHTQAAFFQRLKRLRDDIGEHDTAPLLVDWYRDIKQAAETLFDHWATSGSIELENPRRIAKARSKLHGLLRYTLAKKMGINLKQKQEKAA